MSSLHLTLPDDVRSFVDSEASAAGYADASAYVQDVLRALWKQREKARLESTLIQTIEDGQPSIEITPEFWTAMKERARRRHDARVAAASTP